ncbi:hypothetical protein D0469_09890 [Peribacillus saganii]|uniref:DUF4870 domain-containing protein n=1 Tax=Peribacillus saganii TaxID=2303992 RepID=A0A372LNU7_9BACI|nr:DUF4870 domain-containing protein [Peribacillus saganii]RFU69372.1 hypothetical protein D0469_09890 [Peribacillus saganii]
MDTRKVMAGLSYLSVLFAPFVVPIIIFFVAQEEFVKAHAKKAFLSHLIPLVAFPIIGLSIFADIASVNSGGEVPIFLIIAMIVSGLIGFAVTIWNLVKGIKILISK